MSSTQSGNGSNGAHRTCGRRQGITGNPTRELIVSAAEALFADYGRDATTTEKVGQRARVPPGVIFYYFATKDELFTAVLEERSPLDVLKTELPQAVRASTPGSASDTLTAVGMQFVRALHTRDRVVRILLRECSTDERAAHHFRLLSTYATGLVARYLRRKLPGRRMPIDDAARMFVSHLIVAAAIDRAYDPEFAVTAAVAVVLGGFHLCGSVRTRNKEEWSVEP